MENIEMQTPTFKNEWNVTTVIACITFIISVGAYIFTFGQFTNQVSNIQKDVAEIEIKNQTENSNIVATLKAEAVARWETHNNYHRERAQEVSAQNARTDERLKAVEGLSTDVEQLKYRMAVQEQGTTSLTNAVNQLRQTLNDLSSDMKITREILTRMEKQGK